MALLFSNTVAEAADWLTETTGELWTVRRLLEAMLFAGAEVQAITPVDAQFGLYEWERNDGATLHSFIRRRSIARPSLVSLHRAHVAQLLEQGETWVHLAEPPCDQDDVSGGTLRMIDQRVLATEDRYECDGYVFVEPWLTALKIDLSMIRLAATDLRELLAAGTVTQLTSRKETNPSAPDLSNVPTAWGDTGSPDPFGVNVANDRAPADHGSASATTNTPETPIGTSNGGGASADDTAPTLANLAPWKKGAERKAAKYRALGDYAFQLANKGNYRSRRQAAKEVASAVLQYARKNKIALSEDNSERMINKWLAERNYSARPREQVK